MYGIDGDLFKLLVEDVVQKVIFFYKKITFSSLCHSKRIFSGIDPIGKLFFCKHNLDRFSQILILWIVATMESEIYRIIVHPLRSRDV